MPADPSQKPPAPGTPAPHRIPPKPAGGPVPPVRPGATVPPVVPAKPVVPVKPVVSAKAVAPIPVKPLAPVAVKPVAPTPLAPRPVAPPVAARSITPAPAAASAPSAPTAAPAPAPAPTSGAPAAENDAKPSGPVAPVKPTTVKPKGLQTRRAVAGPDPHLGRILGRCRIDAKIGQGKTATVYRAEHTALGRLVAVKILLPEVLEHPQLVAKFEAEARAIARLDHPNVLKIYDVFVEGSNHGIVMELLEGENVLDVVTNDGKLEPEDALRIVRQAAAGLEAAHAKGIVHRDVKPQNLVILEDGTVKLVDFGLATDTDADTEASTGRIGTPHYMAPEVCEAKGGGPPSDVYSLGVSLYHLLVGQPPYAGRDLKGILAGHVEARPLEPEKQVRGLSPALGDLVRSMTKRDPLTRLTLGEVIEKVDHLGGEALKKDLKVRVRRRRRHTLASGSARSKGIPVVPLVLALVGIVIAVLVFSKKSPSRPTTPPPGPEAREPDAPPAPPAPLPPTPGTPPGMEEPPPPETEAERKAREAKEAADKKASRAALSRQAQLAFDEAVDFARRNEGDKNSVIQTYRVMWRSFPELPQGKEAKRRATLIELGEMHPHPDKSFAEKTAVDAAWDAWVASRIRFETLVTGHLYDEAIALVPPPIDDAEGKLSEDVEFHRRLAKDLLAFRAFLVAEVNAMKGPTRTVSTPKGGGRISVAKPTGLQVTVDGKVLELPWAELWPEALADLGKRAFAGKDVEHLEALAAFAYAHKQRDAFFSAAISVKTAASLSGASAHLVEKMLARAPGRFGK